MFLYSVPGAGSFTKGVRSRFFLLVSTNSFLVCSAGLRCLKEPSRGNGTVLLIVPFKIKSLYKLHVAYAKAVVCYYEFS
jgi:hypothetical protein